MVCAYFLAFLVAAWRGDPCPPLILLLTNRPRYVVFVNHQNWDLNFEMHSQEDKLLDLRDSRTWCT